MLLRFVHLSGSMFLVVAFPTFERQVASWVGLSLHYASYNTAKQGAGS